MTIQQNDFESTLELVLRKQSEVVQTWHRQWSLVSRPSERTALYGILAGKNHRGTRIWLLKPRKGGRGRSIGAAARTALQRKFCGRFHAHHYTRHFLQASCKCSITVIQIITHTFPLDRHTVPALSNGRLRRHSFSRLILWPNCDRTYWSGEACVE